MATTMLPSRQRELAYRAKVVQIRDLFEALATKNGEPNPHAIPVSLTTFAGGMRHYLDEFLAEVSS